MSPPDSGLEKCQVLVVSGIKNVWQAVLRVDIHTGTQRHQASLAVWNTVDFEQAFKANTHHAVRSSTLARYRRITESPDASREQSSSDTGRGGHLQRFAIERHLYKTLDTSERLE